MIGHLVSEFLCGDSSPMEYCSQVLHNGRSYNGFALITADLRCKITNCSKIENMIISYLHTHTHAYTHTYTHTHTYTQT